MKKIAIALSLATALGAGAAYAQQGTGNGEMTRSEAQAHATEMFSRLDVNKDGKLDQADRAARQTQMFDRIDTDGDGQISRAEFAAMHDRGGAKATGKTEADSRHGDRRGGRGMMWMGGMGGAKDGTITQAEFVAAALARFDRADTNKDGKVTREERQAAHKTMRDERRAKQGGGTPQSGTTPAPAR